MTTSCAVAGEGGGGALLGLVEPDTGHHRLPAGRRLPGVVARAASRSTRSASTARTRGEVSARTCTGTSCRSSSGVQAARVRAVRSSASSRRTAGSVTTPWGPAVAMIFSTSPRMSAAFHDDRRAPSRDRASSVTASRLSRPIGVGASGACPIGVAVAEVVQLLDPPRCELGAVGSGTTLSGRASAQARRSQVRRSFGPGSVPGCSRRQAAS